MTTGTRRGAGSTETLIERLVERGREIEAQGVDRVRTLTGGVRDQLAGTVGSFEEAVEDSARRAMQRARIPTRDQLERLSRRIDELAELVRDIEARAGEQGSRDRTYHVAPHSEGGWKVEAENAQRATSLHRTKAEAVDAGRELAARNPPARMVIHRSDGTIQEHRSYE